MFLVLDNRFQWPLRGLGNQRAGVTSAWKIRGWKAEFTGPSQKRGALEGNPFGKFENFFIVSYYMP